ncbi:MAG TPA: hypothetical protein VF880_19090 [Actinomycetes bacterium]|jgi:phage baseplate assembly protein W
MDPHARFGTDLRLLDDLERQDSRNRGRDLVVTRRRPDPDLVDLDTVSAAENLQHALLLRFLTQTGELAAVGHPTYGTALPDLIGERNTETTRNRTKMLVLQALAEEPRVERVLDLQVTQAADDPSRIDVRASLLAIGADTPLNLVFGFSLAGGLVGGGP